MGSTESKITREQLAEAVSKLTYEEVLLALQFLQLRKNLQCVAK